jgi:lipopolysaccharide export system permease protein
LPISLLFAIAYTLGDLYARNELTSIISSGIPFWRFGASLLIIGVFVSVFSFFFEDRLVIPTLKIKNEMTRELRHQNTAEEKNNIVLKTNGGLRVYSIDYFDDENEVLNGVVIVEKNEDRTFKATLRAPQGTWVYDHWEFTNPIYYHWVGDILRISEPPADEVYNESPETFRRSAVDPADLNARDTKGLIGDLREAGLAEAVPAALADYYHRFSFSAASFVVALLSITMGGRFRKNIMLMSLLASLTVAVVFYVIEMITMMLARFGYIHPIFGAWSPVFFFSVIGVVLIRFSKT